MLPSRATLEAEFRNTTRSLREACPAEFWERFRTWQLAMQEFSHTEIAKCNASLGQARTNFLKHLSYREDLVWDCPKTGTRTLHEASPAPRLTD